MDIQNNFLATGIGSLPFLGHREAVLFILEEFKRHIPFLPQLPKKSFLESMHIQITEGFPGVTINSEKKNIFIDTASPSFLEEFEKLFSALNNNQTDYFAISQDYSKGFHEFIKLASNKNMAYVKSQIIGPFSFGMAVLDESNKPILLNKELQEIIPQFLGFKAAWQIRRIKEYDCAEKVIVFIDEPYLVAIGTNQFASFSKQDVAAKIDVVVDMIHRQGALAGIHCCGNTDWSICLETKVDIISFDAFDFLDSLLIYKDSLRNFIERRGLLAWGIVPNKQGYQFGGFLKRAVEIIKNNPALLKNGALITPSCGCGTLPEAEAKKIHKTAVAIAQGLSSLR